MAPIKWKSKILLAGVEAEYGVDPGLDGANGVLAKNVVFMPMEGNDEERDLELPYMGSMGAIPTDVHAKLTFGVELAASGAAGTAPAWGNLLRACGVAETITAGTSVLYNPVSDDHESAAFSFQIGGTLHRVLGARGNCSLDFTSQKVPMLNFEFWGLFVAPVEAARVLPTNFGSYKTPLVVSDANTPTFTLGGVDLVMRSCQLDLGNAVEPDLLVNEESIELTDKGDQLRANVRAVPITTFDPYGLSLSQADVPMTLQHGTAAGQIIKLDVPHAQMQRVPGLEEAKNIANWPLAMTPRPSAGNDQWTLTLS